MRKEGEEKLDITRRVAALSRGLFEGAEILVHLLSEDLDSFSKSHRLAQSASQGQKGHTSMTWFYEIRRSNNDVLKRDDGYATQDAAKIAGREDAKKMKKMLQPHKPDVGTILVGQNAEEATRY